MSKSNKMSRFPHDAKVYVGDLGSNADKQEIEDAFSYYGPLRSVWVARNPPGFAFVEFEDARDAEDAVRGLDGRTICGRRARVELSTGKSARGYRSRGGRGRSPGRREDRCYECGNRGHFARDCRRRGGRRGRSRSRSRSRDREYRTRSRSYSRSPPPKRSNKSPRRSKSPRYNDSRVSKSPRRDSRSKSPRSKSMSPRSKSRSQSRDDSRSRNGDD
ncbi:serine/arginine-rich splicing factor 7-like isoform X2 [Chironomus tepperi]|uniref:serine/arginine-rich splicing factor 7-like isoform X1 n=1 Tax=Chironomus tepperi TaxID=113505 RepID=UPI00391F073C